MLCFVVAHFQWIHVGRCLPTTGKRGTFVKVFVSVNCQNWPPMMNSFNISISGSQLAFNLHTCQNRPATYPRICYYNSLFFLVFYSDQDSYECVLQRDKLASTEIEVVLW